MNYHQRIENFAKLCQEKVGTNIVFYTAVPYTMDNCQNNKNNLNYNKNALKNKWIKGLVYFYATGCKAIMVKDFWHIAVWNYEQNMFWVKTFDQIDTDDDRCIHIDEIKPFLKEVLNRPLTKKTLIKLYTVLNKMTAKLNLPYIFEGFIDGNYNAIGGFRKYEVITIPSEFRRMRDLFLQLDPGLNKIYSQLNYCLCGEIATLRCVRCSKKYYCSRNCQKKDWIIHKKECFKSH